jgi:hypothetical protein
MENIKPTPGEIFDNKRDDKVYVSPKFAHKNLLKDETGAIQEIIRPIRKISKIITASEGHEYVKQGQEMILRLTPEEKQEIIVSIFEDTRSITTLKVAKYNKKTGSLYNGDMVLIGTEIRKLRNFLNSITYLPIEANNERSQQFTDEYLQQHILSKEQAFRLLAQFPDLLNEISKGNLSSSDITELSKRKENLKIFDGLLSKETTESEWQKFFEANTWIFGYGLNFVFNAPLEGKKLEQYVIGYDISGSGKRVDALLSRKGIIEATCFVEIKKHNTQLLEKEQYRPECYSVSKEVSGGVSQIQKSIQKSLLSLKEKFSHTDDDNNPIKNVYNYQPKGYLVVGSLSEFDTEKGVNESKYSSFELFRRNLSNPEIITFDELYERAKFIVSTTVDTGNDNKIESDIQTIKEDDLPF